MTSIDPQALIVGPDTFGHVTVDEDGRPATPGQVLRDVAAQAERAAAARAALAAPPQPDRARARPRAWEDVGG